MIMKSTCYYIIANSADITQEMLNRSTSRIADNVRLNNDGTKAILKFDYTDDLAKAFFINYRFYTKSELMEQMALDGYWG